MQSASTGQDKVGIIDLHFTAHGLVPDISQSILAATTSVSSAISCKPDIEIIIRFETPN